MIEDLTREWCLIHAVFQGGQKAFREARSAGVESSHLGAGSDEALVWDLFEASLAKSGMPGPLDVFHTLAIEVPPCTEPCEVSTYAGLILKSNLYNVLSENLSKVIRNLASDPFAAREALHELVQKTVWSKTGQIDSTSSPDAALTVKDAYLKAEEYRKSGKLQGLSSPWPSWDKRSLGVLPGKLIILLAKREMGKTMLSLAWVNHIWENDLQKGECVLYVSMEMDPLSLKQRLFAIRNRLDYAKFREGRLTHVERKRFLEFCDERAKGVAEDEPKVIFVYSDMVSTVADIAALASEYKPKLVVIDGLYILSSGNHKSNWEQVMGSAKDAKLLIANGLNMPVMVTSQFSGSTKRNDMKADADSAGYAKAMSDYADIVLGIVADEKVREDRQRVIRCLKSREFRPLDWRIDFDLESMKFAEVGVIEDGEETPTTSPTTSTGSSRKSTVVFGSGGEVDY